MLNFGKIGYTFLQLKNGVTRLHCDRTYDLNMINRVVGRARNAQRTTGRTSKGSASNVGLSGYVSISFNAQSSYKDALVGSNAL